MNLLLSDPAFLSVAAAVSGGGGYDADAQAYITAVETADGQALETAVKDAINAFVVGCKADGIWDAIKASCILAGARTLSGALVPLAGTAPTNFNFVAGDYDRKTGLVGDGSTKYLDSGRSDNADPQDNRHLGVFKTAGSTNGCLIGSALITSPFNRSTFIDYYFTWRFAAASSESTRSASAGSLNFFGVSRSNSTSFTTRINNSSASVAYTSIGVMNRSYYVFNRSGGNFFTSSRLAFYSIGESLDLALLDARVTTLISAFAAAIP